MKKIIVLVVFCVSVSNAFAICENEIAEKNEFRDLCFGFGGASAIVAAGGCIAIPGFGGLLGIIPGLVANNQCRIWLEKEANLQRCEAAHAQAQRDELARQHRALQNTQQRQTRISAINTQYNDLENTARDNHRLAVRNALQGFIAQGRNLRDPLVQAELRQEMQRLEGELNSELLRLTHERQREVSQVG